MHIFIGYVLIVICLAVIIRAAMRPAPVAMYAATLSLFSIGFFGLPTILIARSSLRYLPERELIAMITMALTYLVFVLGGLLFHQTRLGQTQGIRLPLLDAILERNWWAGMLISNALVITHRLLNPTQTFYQADSVESYVEGLGAFWGLLGFVTALSQAASAVYLALAIRDRNWRRAAAAGIGILTQMAMVLSAGQRLIFIAPAMMVFTALVAQRSYKQAATALGAGVLALLIISPFAVALRSGTWNKTQDEIAANFSYGENPVDTMLQSIVDRADILETMTKLKGHVDANGRVGPIYYYSVLVIPVPRFIYREKPYILSSDGTISGEASVLVWHLIMGPRLGSLTAFGSIVAYREGGWLWVPMNGFLAGLAFAFFLTAFSRGGIVGHAFFSLAFFRWSVMKVPPSLMEMMVDVMTYLPVIALLYVLNRFLESQLASKYAKLGQAPPAPSLTGK